MPRYSASLAGSLQHARVLSLSRRLLNDSAYSSLIFVVVFLVLVGASTVTRPITCLLPLASLGSMVHGFSYRASSSAHNDQYIRFNVACGRLCRRCTRVHRYAHHIAIGAELVLVEVGASWERAHAPLVPIEVHEFVRDVHA